MLTKINDSYRYILLLLVLGSFVLVLTASFLIEAFSTTYGTAIGAVVQSSAYNQSVAQVLQSIVLNRNLVGKAIVESYFILAIAMLLTFISSAIYYKFEVRQYGASRRYLLLHLALTFVFIAMFFIATLGFGQVVGNITYLVAYFGMLLCVITDIYLEHTVHSGQTKGYLARSINISPETPYANMQLLKERLFSRFSGNLRIVDKHFNSEAMSNLYRLIEGSLENLSRIDVITSSEMLDTRFGDNYNDLRNELQKSNIDFEVRIMNPEDAKSQHERFIMDSDNAFKIPPLNIINRKSEHIVKVNFGESEKRFEYLYKRATKLDNYLKKTNQNG